MIIIVDSIVTRQIYYFFDKLDVKGLGMKNVEKLYDAGLNTILKILNAKYEDIFKLDGFIHKICYETSPCSNSKSH